MAKIPHEALHHIFREQPSLFTRAMRRVLDEDFPDIREVAELNCDLTAIEAIDRQADTILLVDTVEDREIIVIEPQTKIDEGKVRSWAWYVSFLENKYQVPVTLLVITPDADTARWARGPLGLGPRRSPTMTTHPRVVGPDNMPFITDSATAAEDVVFSVLSVLTHRFNPEIRKAMEPLAGALGELDNPTGKFWVEFVEGGLGEGCTRTLWKEILMTMTYGYVSEFRLEARAEGRVEGRAEGRVEATIDTLLIVLESHGLRPSEAERERITSCADETMLLKWTARVAHATCVADIFVD